jgi:hypothetical protein
MAKWWIVIATLGLLIWEAHPRLSPDGEYYWSEDPPRPYGGRWLMPWLLPRRLDAWHAVAIAATAATAAILTQAGGWLAAVLWLGLASTRTNLWLPVLTDQVGILLLTSAIVLPWPWNLAAVLIGGCVNEKVPVFAALLGGSPALLLGLLGWAPAYLRARRADSRDPVWLTGPFGAAWRANGGLFDLRKLALPWGVALLGLGQVSYWAVAGAYAQLALAQDRARLYQWIGPAVCLAAAASIPEAWVVPLVVVHLTNPWREVL